MLESMIVVLLEVAKWPHALKGEDSDWMSSQ